MHVATRFALRIAIALCCAGFALAAHAQEFPYLARVAVEGAGVYNAPDGYSTGELDPGFLVQVVRKQGDWLAIRPPEGSYCWINGREVQPDDAQVKAGTVVGRAVPVLVGTPLDIETLKSQVKLGKGERVEILGSEEMPTADGSGTETWYKIAPPPHEVRWVPAEEIEAPEPVEAPAIASNDPNSALPPPPRDFLPGTIRPISGEEPIDDRGPRPVGSAGMKLEPITPTPAANPRAAVELNAPPVPLPRSEGWKPARLTSRTPGTSTPRGSATWNLTDANSGSGGAARLLPPSASGEPATGGMFQRQLEDLEVRLARMTAADPSQWRLDDLRRDAERLVGAGSTLVERGRARLLLERVAELDDWKARYEKMLARQLPPGTSATTVASAPSRTSFGGTGGNGGSGAAITPPATTSPRSPLGPASTLLPPTVSGPNDAAGAPAAPAVVPMAGVSALDTTGLPDYSGKGYLMPIVTSRPDIPRYALVDEQGQVLQFVTPAPGVNINRYLRRPVGINGRVENPPQLNKPHLTADRVIELDRHLR